MSQLKQEFDAAIGQLTGEGAPYEISTDAAGLRYYQGAPANLREALAVARNHGDREFLIYEGERWTFSDIMRRAAAYGSKLQSEHGIAVGDRVIWNPPTRRMGQLVYGKAMDDRVCLAIMDRLLELLDFDRLAYDLTYVSTVQEEIGLVGAESAAEQAGCEIAIALDVGLEGFDLAARPIRKRTRQDQRLACDVGVLGGLSGSGRLFLRIDPGVDETLSTTSTKIVSAGVLSPLICPFVFLADNHIGCLSDSGNGAADLLFAQAFDRAASRTRVSGIGMSSNRLDLRRGD